MTEGVQGRAVALQIVTGGTGEAGVVAGHHALVTGVGNGQTACGVDIPRQSLHDGLGAELTAEARHHHGGAGLGLGGEVNGLAVLQHQHHGRARLGHAEDQLPLTAAQNQARAVVSLAAGDQIVTADQNGDLGLTGDLHGLLDHIRDIGIQLGGEVGLTVHVMHCRPVVVGDGTAVALADLGAGVTRLQLVIDRADGVAVGLGGIPADLLGSRGGADDGDAGIVLLQRQDSVVGEQNHARSGGAEVDIPMLFATDHRLVGGLVEVGVLEQTQLEFHLEDAQHRLVDIGFRELALQHQLLHEPRPMAGVVVTAALHIQAARKTAADAFLLGGGDAVVGHETVDTAPVGAGDTLQAEAILQHLPQVVRTLAHHLAVDAVVAGHDVVGTAPRDTRLKDGEVAGLHLAAAHTGGSAV